MRTLTLKVRCRHSHYEREVFVVACKEKDGNILFIPNGCEFESISSECEQCKEETLQLAQKQYSNIRLD